MSQVLAEALQNYTAAKSILGKHWLLTPSNEWTLKDKERLNLLPPGKRKEVTNTVFSYEEAIELEIQLERFEEILCKSMGFSPRPLDTGHFVDVMEMTSSLSSAIVAAHGGPDIRRHLNMSVRDLIIELAPNKVRFIYVGERTDRRAIETL